MESSRVGVGDPATGVVGVFLGGLVDVGRRSVEHQATGARTRRTGVDGVLVVVEELEGALRLDRVPSIVVAASRLALLELADQAKVASDGVVVGDLGFSVGEVDANGDSDVSSPDGRSEVGGAQDDEGSDEGAVGERLAPDGGGIGLGRGTDDLAECL